MSTEITIRHVKLSVALQNAAQKKADKYAVSLAVQGGQKTTVDASAKDADATAALNAVFDKANAQLRRASKKRQEVRK